MSKTTNRTTCAALAVVATLTTACAASPDGPDRTAGPDDPSATTTSAPSSVTITANGDMLAHTPVVASAARAADGEGHDFAPSLAEIAPALRSADLALCHLETPLTRDEDDLSVPGTKVFNVPAALADGLVESGYDGCDTASNHTWDQGLDGVRETAEVLEDAGLGNAGPSPTRSGRGLVGRYDVDGVQVAHLAYSYTMLNTGSPSTQVPPDAPWLTASLWPAHGLDGILRDADEVRADGADLVVVSMHWGQEYTTAPTTEQRELARAMLTSDRIDLVLGTHAHVVQPCERIDGRYVFYGLGNALSNQSPQTASGLRPETQEGVLATVTLTKGTDRWRTSSATYLPTRVDLDGHVVRPATPDDGTATHARVGETLRGLGAGRCPVTEAR